MMYEIVKSVGGSHKIKKKKKKKKKKKNVCCFFKGDRGWLQKGNKVYPGKPQYYYIKMGCKGVYITRTCLHDEIFLLYNDIVTW